MAFSLFGGSKDTRVENTTNATDASATAAEGSLAASGGSSITVNSVDPEITRQAFASNTEVTTRALNAGVDSLAISASLVPDLLKRQSEQTSDVLKAAQDNNRLAEQFASIGAAGARSAATGGASSLLEGPALYIAAAVAALGLWLVLRKKG